MGRSRPSARAAILGGVAAGLSLIAGPVAAQTMLDSHFTGKSGCYLREYTADHLASHPVQRTRIIAIGPDGWAPPGGWGGDGAPFVLRLHVTLRDLRRLEALAYCEAAAPGLACAMEGDAGAFTLEPARRGAVMLRPVREGILLEDDQGLVILASDAGDDRAFLIPPVPADACP
ncbi:MAG: hypothetical protein KF887_11910 [Paracoccaceae bacterium]|nr:MAG: hypothetical protein KF887_11910 [Paracoccaceae bacterium]